MLVDCYETETKDGKVMPIKGGRMTSKEKVFAERYANTGDKAYAATAAGYLHPYQRSSDALSRPAIQAEIRSQQLARLFNEALPAAVRCLVSIVVDSKAPAGARVQASKVIFDRTLGASEEGQGKEAHEMTSEELARAIAELERVASDRAKVVDHIEIAQVVRNDDDIFQ